MFNQYNPQQYNIDRLKRQREEIDNLINNYQQIPPQQPINNIINQTQQPNANNNLVEWRVLNETEQVDNLYVQNKTLFINEKNMVLKDVDGSLKKWEVKQIYPIDKKDERINELETKLKEMEAKLNEYTKPIEPIRDEFKSDVNDDGNAKSKSKTNTKQLFEQTN